MDNTQDSGSCNEGSIPFVGINKVGNQMKLTCYTKSNCGLCEEAKLQLNIVEDYFNNLSVQYVDITSNPALEDKYMLEVPVVTYNDQEIQYGNIDCATVIDYIESL